jgi:hypothetical protein
MDRRIVTRNPNLGVLFVSVTLALSVGPLATSTEPSASPPIAQNATSPA